MVGLPQGSLPLGPGLCLRCDGPGDIRPMPQRRCRRRITRTEMKESLDFLTLFLSGIALGKWGGVSIFLVIDFQIIRLSIKTNFPYLGTSSRLTAVKEVKWYVCLYLCSLNIMPIV